jgi:hypothetical protein
MKPPRTTPSRRSPAVSYAIALFLLMLVTMQLWLLTATMNAYLGGDESVIWPAAVASAICFALAAGLLRYVAEDNDSPG